MLLTTEFLRESAKTDSVSHEMDVAPSAAPTSDPLVPNSVGLLLTLFQLDANASFGHVTLYSSEVVWGKTCYATLALLGIGCPIPNIVHKSEFNILFCLLQVSQIVRESTKKLHSYRPRRVPPNHPSTLSTSPLKACYYHLRVFLTNPFYHPFHTHNGHPYPTSSRPHSSRDC